jgi:hypothetical protein
MSPQSLEPPAAVHRLVSTGYCGLMELGTDAMSNLYSNSITFHYLLITLEHLTLRDRWYGRTNVMEGQMVMRFCCEPDNSCFPDDSGLYFLQNKLIHRRTGIWEINGVGKNGSFY